MTGLAAGLLATVVLLVLALYRQQQSQNAQIALILSKAELERRHLLDRIQHPQVRQVDPQDFPPLEPPRDAGELAQVGQIVPEFVHVGNEAPNEEPG